MYIKTDLASALWDRNWEDGDQQQAPVQWGSVQLNLCKNISIMSPCQSTIHLLTPQTKKACCESWIRFFFLHSKSYLELYGHLILTRFLTNSFAEFLAGSMASLGRGSGKAWTKRSKAESRVLTILTSYCLICSQQLIAPDSWIAEI